MKRVAVINAVGLSPSLLGARSPRINAIRAGGAAAVIEPAFPAVTCTAQSNYVTGASPSGHGIVANGWYNRELAEVQFWKQSNHLVQGPKIWDVLRRSVPDFTCAKLFWWYNMYSTADCSITPRPMYPADGRKVFDIYTWPFSIRSDIKRDLGEFPFPTFWGPAAGLDTPQGSPDAVSKWIAASAKWIEERHRPTLSLIYLPHLDYNLQRFGPGDPRIAEDVERIDGIVGDLADYFQERKVELIVLSEYGISAVNTPIHLNRHFRERGWIAIKDELGLEILDCGASRVFAVADHQVAHVYVQDPALTDPVRDLMAGIPGVAAVLGAEEKRAMKIDHARAGDLIAVAKSDAWFTYYYWVDDALAPDFARCVDIHRKPGYDPVELFLDPAKPLIKLRILSRLAKKKLGFRMLMDVIPLDATLVKGSHGAQPDRADEFPMLISSSPTALDRDRYDSTDVFEIIRRTVVAG